MSKGKDFRAPRKRGFDDDGPMPFEPKTRSSRAFGGGPDSGFGGASLGGPGGAAAAPVSGPTVDAVVKWFKADKGYGFVELAGGQGDAFLHANALHAAGHDAVPSGAKLRVQVGAGAKGAQVTRVLEVDATGVVERPQRPRNFWLLASSDSSLSFALPPLKQTRGTALPHGEERALCARLEPYGRSVSKPPSFETLGMRLSHVAAALTSLHFD